MNTSFIREAFNEVEQAKIIKLYTTGVAESPYDEKIFVLDEDQMKKYFPWQAASFSVSGILEPWLNYECGVKSLAKPTQYTMNKGLPYLGGGGNLFVKGVLAAFDYVKDIAGTKGWDVCKGCSDYWLKNKSGSDELKLLSATGDIVQRGLEYLEKLYGVRPAIWVTY